MPYPKGDRDDLAVMIYLDPMFEIEKRPIIFTGMELSRIEFCTHKNTRPLYEDWEDSEPIFTFDGLIRWAFKVLTVKNPPAGEVILHQHLHVLMQELFKGGKPRTLKPHNSAARNRAKLLAMAGIFGRPEVLQTSVIKDLRLGDVTLLEQKGYWMFSERAFSFRMAAEFAAHILADPRTLEEDYRYHLPWIVRRSVEDWEGTDLKTGVTERLQPLQPPFDYQDSPKFTFRLISPGEFSWELFDNHRFAAELAGKPPEGLSQVSLRTRTDVERAELGLHEADGRYAPCEIEHSQEVDGEVLHFGVLSQVHFQSKEELLHFFLDVAIALDFTCQPDITFNAILPEWNKTAYLVTKRSRKEELAEKYGDAEALDVLSKRALRFKEGEVLRCESDGSFVFEKQSWTEAELFSIICTLLADKEMERQKPNAFCPFLSVFSDVTEEDALVVETQDEPQQPVIAESAPPEAVPVVTQPLVAPAEVHSVSAAHGPEDAEDASQQHSSELHPDIARLIDSHVVKFAAEVRESL